VVCLLYTLLDSVTASILQRTRIQHKLGYFFLAFAVLNGVCWVLHAVWLWPGHVAKQLSASARPLLEGEPESPAGQPSGQAATLAAKMTVAFKSGKHLTIIAVFFVFFATAINFCESQGRVQAVPSPTPPLAHTHARACSTPVAHAVLCVLAGIMEGRARFYRARVRCVSASVSTLGPPDNTAGSVATSLGGSANAVSSTLFIEFCVCQLLGRVVGTVVANPSKASHRTFAGMAFAGLLQVRHWQG
jgi:hypothetical protein